VVRACEKRLMFGWEHHVHDLTRSLAEMKSFCPFHFGGKIRWHSWIGGMGGPWLQRCTSPWAVIIELFCYWFWPGLNEARGWYWRRSAEGVNTLKMVVGWSSESDGLYNAAGSKAYPKLCLSNEQKWSRWSFNEMTVRQKWRMSNATNEENSKMSKPGYRWIKVFLVSLWFFLCVFVIGWCWILAVTVFGNFLTLFLVSLVKLGFKARAASYAVFLLEKCNLFY